MLSQPHASLQRASPPRWRCNSALGSGKDQIHRAHHVPALRKWMEDTFATVNADALKLGLGWDDNLIRSEDFPQSLQMDLNPLEWWHSYPRSICLWGGSWFTWKVNTCGLLSERTRSEKKWKNLFGKFFLGHNPVRGRVQEHDKGTEILPYLLKVIIACI